MEFYSEKALYNELIARFNSQRDGILLRQSLPLVTGLGFQFPTGWNSTVTNCVDLKEQERFNSQRDGILRWDNTTYTKEILVSIPNGMEFYTA